MGEIRGRMTLEPYGPAGGFLLSEEQAAEIGGGARVFPVPVQVNGRTLQLRLTRMGVTHASA